MTDWFEDITGFRERPYAETQAALSVADGELVSTHSPRRCAVGRLETPSLADLRQRSASDLPAGELRVSVVNADARNLHCDPANRGALFQVASQFNLLEMTGPDITPEHGVTRYRHDPTQGPACAMAAGAATIYRNYLAPCRGGTGQLAGRQIDCLGDIGEALGNEGERLWRMRNGYALFSQEGLSTVDARIAALDEPQRVALRERLRIGLHWGVEVTDRMAPPGHVVSQAFCSALPVAYHTWESDAWARIATLVLEASYEATLLAAALLAAESGRGRVFLTRVGGGAFGNDAAWIDAALARALKAVRDRPIDVVLVTRGGGLAAGTLRCLREAGIPV